MSLLSWLWSKPDMDVIARETRDGHLRIARAAYERGQDDGYERGKEAGYARAMLQLAATGERDGADALLSLVRSRAADASRIDGMRLMMEEQKSI